MNSTRDFYGKVRVHECSILGLRVSIGRPIPELLDGIFRISCASSGLGRWLFAQIVKALSESRLVPDAPQRGGSAHHQAAGANGDRKARFGPFNGACRQTI